MAILAGPSTIKKKMLALTPNARSIASMDSAPTNGFTLEHAVSASLFASSILP